MAVLTIGVELLRDRQRDLDADFPALAGVLDSDLELRRSSVTSIVVSVVVDRELAVLGSAFT